MFSYQHFGLLVIILCCVASAQSALVPFPQASLVQARAAQAAQFSALSPGSFECPALSAAGLSQAYGTCAINLSPTNVPVGTAHQDYEWPYRFQWTPFSGVVMVWHNQERLVGLDTGLDGLVNVSFSDEVTSPSAGVIVLTATGFRSQGTGSYTTSVRALYLDTNGCLSGCVSIPFPASVAPAAGEAFTAASLVGSTLYVCEGVSGAVVRFLDVSGDGIPETRDPSFSASLSGELAPEVLGSATILAFRAKQGFIVEIIPRLPNRFSFRAVQSSAGGFEIVRANTPAFAAELPYGPNRRPTLVVLPSAGQSLLYALVPGGAVIQVEARVSTTDPWQPIGNATTAAVTAFQSITLTRALVQGELVRLHHVTNPTSSMSYTVFGSVGAQVAKPLSTLETQWGGTLVLKGNDLSGTWTGSIESLGSPPHRIAVTLSAISPTQIDVALPARPSQVLASRSAALLRLTRQSQPGYITVLCRIEGP